MEVFVEVHHLLGVALGAVGFLEDVFLGFGVVEFRGSDIEREEDIFAEFVAGFFDGLCDDFEGGLVGLEDGRKSAFVTDCGGEPLALEDAFEGVEDFATHAKGFAEGFSSLRHDHELLNVDGSIGVRAAVHDIHHRDGQNFGVGAADVFVEGKTECLGGGFGGRE